MIFVIGKHFSTVRCVLKLEVAKPIKDIKEISFLDNLLLIKWKDDWCIKKNLPFLTNFGTPIMSDCVIWKKKGLLFIACLALIYFAFSLGAYYIDLTLLQYKSCDLDMLFFAQNDLFRQAWRRAWAISCLKWHKLFGIVM